MNLGYNHLYVFYLICICVDYHENKKMYGSHSLVPELCKLKEWTHFLVFSCLDPSLICKLIQLLLLERSVIVVGRNEGMVTSVATGLIHLIAPFKWEGVFIPLLPTSAREIFDAPVPFVLGMYLFIYLFIYVIVYVHANYLSSFYLHLCIICLLIIGTTTALSKEEVDSVIRNNACILRLKSDFGTSCDVIENRLHSLMQTTSYLLCTYIYVHMYVITNNCVHTMMIYTAMNFCIMMMSFMKTAYITILSVKLKNLRQ